MNGINDWSVESGLLIRVENHPLKIGTDDWLMPVCFMPLMVSGRVIYEDALCICSHATPVAFRKQTPHYIHTVFAIPFWPAHIAESVLEEERSESLSNIFESAIVRIIGDKPRESYTIPGYVRVRNSTLRLNAQARIKCFAADFIS